MTSIVLNASALLAMLPPEEADAMLHPLPVTLLKQMLNTREWLAIYVP